MKRLRSVLLVSLFSPGLLLLSVSGGAAADGSDALPANVGQSLRRLYAASHSSLRSLSSAERRVHLAEAHAQTDPSATTVVADVHLDGSSPASLLRAALLSLGATILAQTPDADTSHSGGTLSVRLPLDQTLAASRLSGVFSITLVRPPHHFVGKATSQGVQVLHADTVQAAGDTGTGLRVGVLSDSFDAATLDALGQPLTDHAADDVASGDLPGPGNPLGHLTPVAVLADADRANTANTDEGRAMLQIVHDLAPGASLAFCTNGATPTAFAANVRALRTDPASPCDVIVDDAVFDEEPFFSDGPAAQAVDSVVHSTALAGRPVLYYSAAGDQGARGAYDGLFNPVDDTSARTTVPTNLHLDQVPAELTSGGFHSFDTRPGHPVLSQKVFVAGTPTTLNFQWDDPWVPDLVSTSYNLLVFDAQGNYLPDLSGTDNAFKTGQAIQLVDLPLGAGKANAVYQLAIARRGDGVQQATHLRYLVRTEGSFRAKRYTTYGAPTIYGHAAASGADAVTAYAYDALAVPEEHASTGPATIYFDAYHNRLPTPLTRQTPSLAAVDGVDTTFFPANPAADTDGNGFPNFYGTSAAAAHAAGVAALLLQASGGPGSLTDVQARAALQGTAAPHLADPTTSRAAATDAGHHFAATLTATGDASDASAFDKTFFQLSFEGPDASELHQLVVNLAGTTEQFDPNVVTGFPFTVSARGSTVSAASVTAKLTGNHPAKLTLTFAPGTFHSGATLAFGLDRDVAALRAGGNSAALLDGAKLTAQVLQGDASTKITGTFASPSTTGYTPTAGFGLLDAAAALAALPAHR